MVPEDINFAVVREKKEGEYSVIGGKLYACTDAEMAVQETSLLAAMTLDHLGHAISGYL